MIKRILMLFLGASTILLNAQERCATEAYSNILKEKYPEYKIARSKANTQTENWIQDHPNNSQKTIITIPVVVHVVWNTNAENISDAQIFSQMDVLNNDFRRANADAINTPAVWQGIASDCEINFCLATIDPNGSATTGITRTQTSLTSFSIQNDYMKSTSNGGIDAWPNEDYLNLWVCDLGNGLLGYATPPSNFLSNEDGVVIGYKYFGTTGAVQSPYHKGRTTTHEIGHWLNLDHIWGNGGNCGNDNVSDTPKQEEENYSCPSFPHNANSCGTSNTNGDMFMNYMDYTNDACMNLFTAGQKTRMIAAINQYRDNLLSHNLCSGIAPNTSWDCVNGGCVDPGNGNGMYSNYNTCVNACNCIGVFQNLSEDFQNNTIAANWSLLNNDNDKTWETTSLAGYNSTSSIYINNADYSANGQYDDLILPIMNFSNSSTINLTFDYAYSLWTDPTSSQTWSDTLTILISSDCGLKWTTIWKKAGTNLVTTTPIYNAFSWTPSNNNDWSSENINLNNYINLDGVIIKFRNINQYENNLFLDNISIDTEATAINEINEELILYPNPANKYLYAETNSHKDIYDIFGQKLISTTNKKIDISILTNGLYIIRTDNLKRLFIKQ